jgi:uncharacterized protein (TIGR03086 family)
MSFPGRVTSYLADGCETKGCLMLDVGPATTELARVLTKVRDDQLDDRTPCKGMLVRDLIDHVDGFAMAFIAAASKTQLPGGGAPRVDGSRIGTDWRERIPAKLDALADAWRDPAAWQDMTQAGGLDLPAQVGGLVALDETIVHGWDLAEATGQKYSCTDELADAARQFVQGAVEQNPNGAPGLFDAPVKVPGEASSLDQLLGLTGRDPSWTPASA